MNLKAGIETKWHIQEIGNVWTVSCWFLQVDMLVMEQREDPTATGKALKVQLDAKSKIEKCIKVLEFIFVCKHLF